jgi:hypothetical protein
MVGTRATPEDPVVSGKTMTDQEELEHLVKVVMGKKGKEHPILRSCRYHGIETADELVLYMFVESMQHMKDDDVLTDLVAGHIGAVFMVRVQLGCATSLCGVGSSRNHIDASRHRVPTHPDVLTMARFGSGDSGWKGTGHSFILHWQNKVREYEEMIPPENFFSEGIKLTMLQNAVSGVPKLHAVKVQAQYDKVRGLVALNYDNYCTLLLSTATNYDLKHTPQRVRDRRVVNVHDTYDYEPDHEASNIDADVFKLMINAHDQRPERARTRLDFSVWNTMSTEDQERWSSFSDEIKGNILNASSSDKPAARKFGSRPPGKFPPRRNPNDNRTRNANLHEISAYDYLQETTLQEGHDINDAHGQDKDEDVFVDSSSSDVPEDTTNPLLAYVTKRSSTPGKAAVNSSPGNLRNVLSTTKKRYEASASEITLNGKTYREVNMAQQQVYRIANYKACKKGETLVDCGANGGIAGSDVRVINKTGRSVDVIGIDNHTVNNLPIVTAGGVIN